MDRIYLDVSRHKSLLRVRVMNPSCGPERQDKHERSTYDSGPGSS